jgi:hypothetical protein
MALSHIAKVVATGLGVALCGVETWLNAEHIAHAEGWGSSLVTAAIVASIGAAASLPFVERCWKTGQSAKAIGLALFFALMAGFSFTASTARVGGKHDIEVTTAQGDNAKAKIAQDAYEAAKKSASAECAKLRGTACRKAEKRLDEATAALQKAPAPKVEDSMARRIAAVLPVSEKQVQTFQPLLLPLAFQIGGFLFLALGLAPGKPENDNWSEQPPVQEAATTTISTEAEAYRWLLGRILQAPNRQLIASGRTLAAMSGVAPATFASWLKKWATEGKVIPVRTGNRTTFTLPKIRRVA